MMVTNHRDLASSGGEPSSTPLGAAMDDLFADIAEEQALSGFTDSRWFYVVKDGLDDFGCQAGPLEQPSEGTGAATASAVAFTSPHQAD